MSKTAVISRDAGAVRWAEGFHAANVPPRFDQLYLVHTKFADVQGRIEWFTHMRDAVPADSRAYQYYDEGKAKIEGFASHMNRLPRSSGCGVSSNDAFRDGFLRTVQQNPVNGIWQGEFRVDTKARHHGLIGF